MKWIRIDRPFKIPNDVKKALHQLSESGYVAYIVGGSVRDFLLGVEPKDHDIVTNATPDQLCELFPNALEVGKEFGVIKVPTQTEILEIATFRKDLEYEDSRHPVGVVFAGPLEDSLRRDFTVNGLFYDPKTQRILDVVDGIADLDKKIIRSIGDATKRFDEDALRLLRAIRFSTTLDFFLEGRTAQAIEKKAKKIKKVSSERVKEELSHMLMGPRPSVALKQLSNLKLIKEIIPELENLKNMSYHEDINPQLHPWMQTLKVLENLNKEKRSFSETLCWAALLNNVGKPIAYEKNTHKNFNDFEREGAVLVKKICQKLKFSKSQTETISILVLEQLKFDEVFRMREATLVRWICQPHFEELLEIHRATALVTHGNLASYDFCLTRLKELQETSDRNFYKILNGNDLIQLGLKPGPRFSRILKTVEDLAIEKKIKTKEEALEFILNNFVD